MRLVPVTLWILAGAVLVGGLYWSFLNTPESTVWSLAASAILLATAVLLTGVTVNGAVTGWRDGLSLSQARRALVGAPAVAPAALLVAFAWWLVGSLTDRMTIYSGPINAWFMATLGWSDVSWLFVTATWLAAWLTWVVAPMLALSLMAHINGDGWRAMANAIWITRVLSPLRMAAATALFVVLVAVPWVYLAPWRPAGLPATSLELAFIIAKLSVTAVLMAAGVALIIRQAASAPT